MAAATTEGLILALTGLGDTVNNQLSNLCIHGNQGSLVVVDRFLLLGTSTQRAGAVFGESITLVKECQCLRTTLYI